MKSPQPAKSKPQQKGKAAQPQPQPQSPQEKLTQAQTDMDHWSQVAALPGLSPNTAALAFNLARSAKAEVALRLKAAEASPEDQDPMLARMLGLNSPSQEQASESTQPTRGSSTRTGTSASTT